MRRVPAAGPGGGLDGGDQENGNGRCRVVQHAHQGPPSQQGLRPGARAHGGDEARGPAAQPRDLQRARERHGPRRLPRLERARRDEGFGPAAEPGDLLHPAQESQWGVAGAGHSQDDGFDQLHGGAHGRGPALLGRGGLRPRGQAGPARGEAAAVPGQRHLDCQRLPHIRQPDQGVRPRQGHGRRVALLAGHAQPPHPAHQHHPRLHGRGRR
mmetsp:Transcript_106472/g.301100  ORF Transcript_106472/g.301100 Transcript_106472/m.301100 type:complete len:212 (-) Transcript_106472:843-1478(-)